jgi:uncharacterized protein (TIGR04222 family)
MNPFDWTGPPFLAFYTALAIAVLSTVVMSRRAAESGPAPAISLSDPYLLAFLRGGPIETIWTALVALFDRGLLLPDGAAWQLARPDAAGFAGAPVERAVLAQCETSRETKAILESSGAVGACNQYQAALERAGALPAGDIVRARIVRLFIAVGLLTAIAATKIFIGLNRGRPVLFLILLWAASVGVLFLITQPRRTHIGDQLLRDAQELFRDLPRRLRTYKAGGASPDPVFAAAVFGLDVLPGDEFPQADVMRRIQRDKSSGGSNGGSGCGSSCGGGCGGGCGGCGG